MRSPWDIRAIYRVMDYVYEWAREGDTPYAQFVHRLALEPMECVKTRLKKQEEIILREIESADKSEPVSHNEYGLRNRRKRSEIF